MIDLKDILIEFKNETVALINSLNAEDFDSLESLLNNRQALIDKLDKINYDKSIFIKLCEENDIIKLNNEMNDLMTEKINNVKSEIKKIALQKNINNNYNTNMSVDSIYFNKKI